MLTNIARTNSARMLRRTFLNQSRLEKDLAEADSHIARLNKLLASDFAKKAPDSVVKKERDKLAAFQETQQRLQSQLKSLK